MIQTKHSKLIQLIQFNRPKTIKEVRFFETKKTENIPEHYRKKIKEIWEIKHKDKFSSPIAAFESILANDSIVDIRTGLTDFRNLTGAYTLSREFGDYSLLDLVNPIGNETMVMTSDGLFIMGYRDPSLHCGGEYDFGGGLSAIWYASTQRQKETLKYTTDFLPGTRFNSKKLLFPHNNVFEQAYRTIPQDFGISLDVVDLNSMRLLGFARDPISVTTDALIFVKLKITSHQYLKEKNLTTSTIGKPEHKYHNFFTVDFLMRHLSDNANYHIPKMDSLGKPIEKHHETKRIEITGCAIGAAVSYFLHNNVKQKSEIGGYNPSIKFDFIEPDLNGVYKFRPPKDLS